MVLQEGLLMNRGVGYEAVGGNQMFGDLETREGCEFDKTTHLINLVAVASKLFT